MRRGVLFGVLVALVVAGPASALPGPPLRTDPALLQRSVTCSGPDLRTAPGTPVLLVHGTYVTTQPWKEGPLEAFERDGHPTCLVLVANRELGDVQDSVEYVVAAVRDVAARAGRPIALVGHSQGAFLSAMALRYWPDLAGDVTDFVGLSGVYDNGTTLADTICAVPCAPAGRQLHPGSALLTALARRPLYPGPSLTAVSTNTDEIVTPQPRAGLLSGARQIAVQDLCPGRYAEHGSMSSDAVALALAMDAIDHPGPADPARVDRSVCAEQAVAGTSPSKAADDAADLQPGIAAFYAQGVPGEPPVRCAFDPACPKPQLQPALALSLARASGTGRPWRVAARTVLTLPPGAEEQCGGSVQVTVARGARILASRSALVGRDCAVAVTFRLGRSAAAARAVAGRLHVTARYTGDAELTAVVAPPRSFRARR